MQSFGAVLACVAVATGVSWLAGPPLAQLALAAFVIQWVAFVPAFRWQTERFYDLTGSLTYLTLLGLAWSAGTPDARGVLCAVLVATWAVRLGSFLFLRIQREGRDGRFDTIKPHAGRFAVAWTLQGLWVFLTALAALVAITAPSGAPLGLRDALGLGLWTFGFAVEVVADRQKDRFRADPSQAGRFIDVGLWSWSRHPNYLGEIVLWTGMCVLASGAFVQPGQWVGLLSPCFVTLLLTRVSGIPLLEQRADARWGGQAAYEAYKARTPVLLPAIWC